MFLAGDIGGTKTQLGIFSNEKGFRHPLAEAEYPSCRYPDLESIVREFLGQTNISVPRACFSVAGPIVGGRARITNLPWIIDERHLCQELSLLKVRLLNDIEAIAYALPFLEPEDLHVLNKGRSSRGGNMAVIAPGTGLGEAFLTWDGLRYRVHASEGGHADFAPSNPLEGELLRYLQERFGHVSYERVCSGIGIPSIYRFLRDRGYAEEPSWMSEQLAQVDEPTPVIVNAALDHVNRCDLCVKSIEMFASILGAEAGNMFLKVLATEGIYLGGGIPRRILPFLESGGFMESFRSKGRMTDLVAQAPVFVILHPKVALFGVACYCFNTIEIMENKF